MKKILIIFMFLFGLGIVSLNAAESERAFGEPPESRDDLKRFESKEDAGALEFGSDYDSDDYEDYQGDKIGDY